MRTQSNTLRPFNAIHFSWSFSCSSLQQEIRKFKHSWYLFMFFVIYMVLALIARQWCLSDIVWDKICLKLEAPNDEDCILGRCLELYRCYIHQNRSTTFHRYINSIFIKKTAPLFSKSNFTCAINDASSNASSRLTGNLPCTTCWFIW